jgi:hypothetical protein
LRRCSKGLWTFLALDVDHLGSVGDGEGDGRAERASKFANARKCLASEIELTKPNARELNNTRAESPS